MSTTQATGHRSGARGSTASGPTARTVARVTTIVVLVFALATFVGFVIRDGGAVLFTVLMAWFASIAMEPAVARLSRRMRRGAATGLVMGCHRDRRRRVRPGLRQPARRPGGGPAQGGPRRDEEPARLGQPALRHHLHAQVAAVPGEPLLGRPRPLRRAAARRRARRGGHAARRGVLDVQHRPAHLLPLRGRPAAAALDRASASGQGPGGLPHGVADHDREDRRLRRGPGHARGDQRHRHRGRLPRHRDAVLARPCACGPGSSPSSCRRSAPTWRSCCR